MPTKLSCNCFGESAIQNFSSDKGISTEISANCECLFPFKKKEKISGIVILNKENDKKLFTYWKSGEKELICRPDNIDNINLTNDFELLEMGINIKGDIHCHIRADHWFDEITIKAVFGTP